MKALQTQFDDRRLSSAVATPTCSSCCCCCCCLATSIASSTLLAQRVAKEGEKHKVFNRHLLTVLAALFVPIVGLLVYFGFWTINTLLRTCTLHYYQFSTKGIGRESYTVCTNPGAGLILPLLLIAPFLVLLYLYARVHIEKPVLRAAMVTALIAVAFTIEFFGGAALILTGVGGIVYLIMVPVIVGWITVWYHRHLGREANDGLPASIELAYPNQDQTTENNNQTPTITEEPPEQNPPTTSA
jgi:hypothetical protein